MDPAQDRFYRLTAQGDLAGTGRAVAWVGLAVLAFAPADAKIAGAALLLASIAFLCIVLRCPSCKARVFWHALRRGDRPDRIRSCPSCGFEPAGTPPVAPHRPSAVLPLPVEAHHDVPPSKTFRNSEGVEEHVPTRIDPRFYNQDTRSIESGTIWFKGSRYTEFRYRLAGGKLERFEYYDVERYLLLEHGQPTTGGVSRMKMTRSSSALLVPRSPLFDAALFDAVIALLRMIDDREVREVIGHLQSARLNVPTR
jgi:hypothetical protein